jgi:hypothetical protein
MFDRVSPPVHQRRAIVRGSLPVVALGLVLTTLALLALPWPSDPAVYGETVSHFERLRGEGVRPLLVSVGASYKTTAWYARRVFDGIALGLVVLGYGGIAAIVGLNAWRVLAVFVPVGVVGVIYSASVGLQPGPMLMAGGFSLVLFGAGLGWASQHTLAHSETGLENYDTHSAT